MRAITYSGFGPAKEVLSLTERPTPDPAPGEVLVRIEVSGVNPSDVKARAGARPGVTKPPFPEIIPHSDGAGRVVAVGDGVDRVRINTRVWLRNAQWRRASGTAAEYVALPASLVFDLPDDVSSDVGATLGIPGLTAAHVVCSGGPVTGQRVLVHGGAGTVGYLAAQLAIWSGAQTTITTRGAPPEHVARLPAVHVDFAQPDLGDRLLAANDDQPFDRIIDCEFGANIATNAQVIAEGGRINAYGSALDMSPTLPFFNFMFKAVTLETALVYLLSAKQCDTAAGFLMQALSEQALHSPIAQVLPLEDTAQAHDLVGHGKRTGAILVKP